MIATLAHLKRTPEVAVNIAAPTPGPADDGEEAAPPPGAAHGPTVPPLNLRATAG